MQIGSLVQSRHFDGNSFGVVLEIGWTAGEEWVRVHWSVLVLDGTLDPYQYIHDLEVICE